MRLRLALALVVAAPLASDPCFALGGSHKPVPPLPPPPPPKPFRPGDTVPTPTPSGPKTGGPNGPSSSTPRPASTGAAPSGPSGPVGGPTGKQAAGASTGASAGVDVTTWEYWWLYNKDAYLEVKRHVDASTLRSGVDADADDVAAWNEALARVLPELAKVLDAKDDHDPTLGAMIALARTCDGDARERAGSIADALARREGDGDRSVAEGSIMALGVLGHEPSVFGLAALFRDAPDARRRLGGRAVPTRVRALAGLSLGLLGARTRNEDARRYAVHHLAQVLGGAADADPDDVQAAAAIAIGMVPLSNATRRAGRATDEAPEASRRSEIALAARVLAKTDGSIFVRAHLPRALARLAATDEDRELAANVLLERLADRGERAEVVHGCVLALGDLGDASNDPCAGRVRAALVKALDAGDAQARCFAMISLARNAARDAPGTSGVASDGDASSTQPGVAPARSLLVRVLTNASSRERCWSALALGVLEHERRGTKGSDAVVEALGKALRDARSPEEVGATSIACGLAGMRRSASKLLEQLAAMKEPRIQGYVALAIGLAGASEGLDPLRAMLEDSRRCSEKLPQTALALALLEDPELVPTLLEMAKDSTSQSTFGAACAALGQVGDRRAVDPLLARLADAKTSAHDRAASIAALGRICDRDRLPWQHAVSEGLNYRAMVATLSDESHTGLLDLQ